MADPIAFESGSAIRALEDALENPRALLEDIGRLMVTKTERAFREQRRGEEDWPPRMVPNVPGIVADLAAGRNPPSRRFDERPAGVDTRNLARSISFEVTDGLTVEFGTTVPYAGAVQEGGERRIEVTDTVRANLTKYLRRQRGVAKRPAKGERGERNKRDAEISKGLGFLFSVDQITVDAQPRPFVMVTDEDVIEISELVARRISDRGRGA
jgi:phage gpG-like protein